MKAILPKFRLEVEKWKWNKDCQIYVSNLGNFKDENKKNLRCLVNSKGYLTVRSRKRKLYNAHRLVLSTWKPYKGGEKLTVDHINHNKADNRLCNLEWVTEKENNRRAAADLVNPEEIVWSENKLTFNGIVVTVEQALSFLKDFSCLTTGQKVALIKGLESFMKSKRIIWKYAGLTFEKVEKD